MWLLFMIIIKFLSLVPNHFTNIMAIFPFFCLVLTFSGNVIITCFWRPRISMAYLKFWIFWIWNIFPESFLDLVKLYCIVIILFFLKNMVLGKDESNLGKKCTSDRQFFFLHQQFNILDVLKKEHYIKKLLNLIIHTSLINFPSLFLILILPYTYLS